MGNLGITVSVFWVLLGLYAVAAAALSKEAGVATRKKFNLRQGVDRRVVHWWRARQRRNS